MSAGFEITNSNGIIVVDENYINLAVVATGTVAANASTAYSVGGNGYQANGTAKSYNINYTAQSDGGFPVLAIYKLGSGAKPCGFNNVGASYNSSTKVWSFKVLIFCPTGMTGDTSFQWYIFDRPPTLGTGYGVEVFDSNAKLVFSSNNYPLKVASFGSTNSLPSGRKYAFISRNGVLINEQDQTVSDSHGNVSITYQWVANFSGNYSTATGVSGTGGIFDGGTGSPASYTPAADEGYYSGNDSSPVMVIDVTNI